MMVAHEEGQAGVRSFVAIEIDDGLRSTLAVIQRRLRMAGAKVSWVPVENIHITLIFLGDILMEAVGRVAEGLDLAAAHVPPFDLVINGLGTFGSVRRPRVIWAGVENRPPEMDALYEGVCAAARNAGIAVEDRVFRPHLTLGRVRGGENVDELTRRIQSANNTARGILRVRRVLLMESRLHPRGARYSVLHAAVLKGGCENAR